MKQKTKCEWTHDEFDDSWDTKCGNKFILNEGGPRENKMEFCPYCGRPIREMRVVLLET